MTLLHTKENGGINRPSAAGNWSAIELTVNANFEDEAKQRAELVEWLNGMLPDLRLPVEASEEEFRACLIDGTVLCSVLDRLSPGSINEWGEFDHSSESHLENVIRFLAAMDQMGLPSFRLLDLQQGSMVTVVKSLLILKEHFNSNPVGDNVHIPSSMSKSGTQPREVSPCGQNIPVAEEEKRKSLHDSKFPRVLRSHVMSEPSAALPLIHHVGHKFHEVFQLKQGCYADLPAAKISEMMKSNSLDNAPTQSLLSVVNGILDESIERKNGEIPHRVACLLRKVVQEIERRISTQAEHLRTQNNLYKTREEKYQSRIRVLKTLATGTSEETQVAMKKFQNIKMEKIAMEEKKKLEEQDMVRLVKEKDYIDLEISTLKQELELANKKYEQHYLQLETQAKGTKIELEEKLKELMVLLEDSRKKVEELEAFSESKAQSWNKKEHSYQTFIDSQFKSLQDLRVTSQSIKQVVLNTERVYSEEFSRLGVKLKGLTEVAENYHMVHAENRKLYNEVQDLKGKIRVYCRIRPFLPGQNGKQTTIDMIGENGELVIVNPLKQGKDSHRVFKFNKVFGPTATQEEVFLDTQPLIRSILDGYNVCIFAYGQTGSGKTYTMSGPDGASKEDWGVNYRALNDLFQISQNRRNSFIYEVGVQMVEIYNEQVRDLLTSDGSQRRLGIWSTTQPNGLAVPDATMHPVNSTGDVLGLMQTGLMNRAVGATALNERSSRSHSVVTVHVRGTDLVTGATLRGNLHLVDLAGSERVDRSEVIGDRLREAQHINKSLSALGDVIFALAQKSPHVPYRNSKLTQVLQSSLGGQAKTLMFIQLNPDIESYFETLSTLKFAERVSGIELGAARSSKEGRDVKELMDQVASLKDIIAKKDDEIERLQMLKDPRTMSPTVNGEKQGTSSLRYVPSSPRRHTLSNAAAQRIQRLSSGKGSGLEKVTSDQDNCSEQSDKHSDASSQQSQQSQQSMDDFRHHKEFFRQSKLATVDTGQNFSADVDLLGFGDADSEERLSDISDGGLSMGTETDGSIQSVVEFTLFPEGAKPAEGTEKSKPASSKLPRPPPKLARTRSVQRSSSKETLKVSTSLKKLCTSGSPSTVKPVKRWQ